jgi:hypothetical protein
MDVNASFARIKGGCARLEACTTPSNGRILGPVLAEDEWTVTFGDRDPEAASLRAILTSVDNCEDVDKLWVAGW